MFNIVVLDIIPVFSIYVCEILNTMCNTSFAVPRLIVKTK